MMYLQVGAAAHMPMHSARVPPVELASTGLDVLRGCRHVVVGCGADSRGGGVVS